MQRHAKASLEAGTPSTALDIASPACHYPASRQGGGQGYLTASHRWGWMAASRSSGRGLWTGQRVGEGDTSDVSIARGATSAATAAASPASSARPDRRPRPDRQPRLHERRLRGRMARRIISPVTVDDARVHDGQSLRHDRKRPVPRRSNGTLYCFEYALASEPSRRKRKWGGGQQLATASSDPGPGKHISSTKIHQTQTRYDLPVRLVASAHTAAKDTRACDHPDPPYTTFTTKARQRNPAARWRSRTSPSTAPASRAPSKPMPRPGRSTPPQKAAYRTDWQSYADPRANSAPASSTGVVEGDEPSQPFSWDTIRLETNTYYEVELITTNADGAQTDDHRRILHDPQHRAEDQPRPPEAPPAKGAYSVGGVITPYNTKITDCHFEYGPTTEYVYSAPCSPQPVGRNEVQAFTIGATAGDFRLTFRGQTTGDIELGADPVNVEKELQALSAIGPEGVTEVTPRVRLLHGRLHRPLRRPPFGNEPRPDESQQRNPARLHPRTAARSSHLLHR